MLINNKKIYVENSGVLHILYILYKYFMLIIHNYVEMTFARITYPGI